MNKRIIVILGALLVICIGLLSIGSGKRYSAHSFVIATPYKNVLFARSFESRVIEATPSVFAVRVSPLNGDIPGSFTNGALIQIAVSGRTLEEANRAAEESARSLCQIISTNYEIKGEVHIYANAREHSFLRDRVLPVIGQWLGP